jgi:hypothetical protein
MQYSRVPIGRNNKNPVGPHPHAVSDLRHLHARAMSDGIGQNAFVGGVLSSYTVAMMKRVPQGKELLKVPSPTVADQVFQELSDILSVTGSEGRWGSEFIERSRIEAKEILLIALPVTPPRTSGWATSLQRRLF